MEFWSAEQLSKEFRAIASFYQIKIGNNMYPCRNHAVIMRKGYASQERPDAVIVMANPGSCSPKDSSYQFPIVHDDFKNIPYVEVKVDPTQLQLMRLMKMMNWNVISIINLSNLCSGKMKEFGEKLKEIESYNQHSIFADDRANEFLLKDTQMKIILAWGQDRSIRKLASEVVRKFQNHHSIFGLQYQSPKWGYRHPNPMIPNRCKDWLEDMFEQLNHSTFHPNTDGSKD
ncbi:DUF1643 domain-containing protein [Alkalihalobacillus deserti]|uniref:DUF1643 domain-containing protein n=1 Tax=Alkalihalobacillus deserti TaxID=2879466 RepID=UPI001D148911|nr:DUF1643 domain-containing protein [Alkalihalobacillus deserti]